MENIILEAIVFVWECVYLILPGAVANMMPVFVKKVRFLDYPVDFGRKWKGKSVFGTNKTFRGLFFGILSSVLIVYVQKLLFSASPYFQGISLVDYSSHNFVLLGFLIGLGVLLGDLVESFFKRRAGIGPGRPWVPWDQLDWVLGMLLLMSFIYVPPLGVIVFFVIALPVGHIVFKHFGYYIGLNKEKW